ncbi:MAG: hypothetical protein ACF8MF_09070 [Phycisphaerales bacterium JB052]
MHEFPNEWAKRIEELLFEFADIKGQKRKWSDRPDREAWDTFVELICQLFDDQQVEDFQARFAESLHPRVSETLKSFLDRLNAFIDGSRKPCGVDEGQWIDTPEWNRCTSDAAAVLEEVKRWGWFKN